MQYSIVGMRKKEKTMTKNIHTSELYLVKHLEEFCEELISFRAQFH